MPSPRIGMAGNLVRDMMLPEDDQAVESNGESRGVKRKRRRPPITEKGKGRNLRIPDSVFRRLELEALRLGVDNSKLVTRILDRELPKDITIVVGESKPATE